MGEEALVGKPDPSILVNHESEVRCMLSTLGHEHFIAKALSDINSDDSLNQGNISLLQRVDRLDNILTAMEDKAPAEPSGHSFRTPHGSKRVSSTPSSLEKRCKSTDSVLEEVEEKGTLVERVSELEKRLLKLQRMLITKSGDNVAYPGLVEVATSAHSTPHHGQAMSHHEQSLQELVDLEKHEVTAAHSAHLEYHQHHEPASIYSEKLDISVRKEESHLHMESHQGMASSECASAKEEDLMAHKKHSQKKSQRIKKWLSKRFHIGSSTRKGKQICSTGHCWSSHTNPKSCWNLKRGELHASSTYTPYSHHPIDEDSP